MSDDGYYPGKGCTCGAWNEGECCCGVDWTDPEIYKLRDRIKELEQQHMALYATASEVASWNLDSIYKTVDGSDGLEDLKRLVAVVEKINKVCNRPYTAEEE